MVPEKITSLSDDKRWVLIYRKKLESDLVRAFALFREHGIEPLLIKGWVSARNYPEGHFRFYQDIDLCVPAKAHQAAKLLKGSEAGERLMIDLHRELRHLDSRPWEDLFADSRVLDLEGVEVRVPAPEDHLRILASHWLNDGGEQKERLWDIFYAVDNRPADFDWDKCLGVVKPNRKGWVIAAVASAKRYLGLRVDDLPFAAETDELPGWFITTLERNWASGHRSNMLSMTLDDKREFLKQLRGKVPPNPIQATIENDGDLFGRRIPIYQAKSLARRAGPAIRSVVRAAVHRQR